MGKWMWKPLSTMAALLWAVGCAGEAQVSDKAQDGGVIATTDGGGSTSITRPSETVDAGTGTVATTGADAGTLAARCSAGKDAEREGWRLAWCDEFNGTSIDPESWTFDIGDGAFLPSGPGWGNQEKEFYTQRAANARVEGGQLVLTALKDGPFHANGPSYPSVYDYSSARLHTRNKVDFLYGRVEVRARVPEGQGVWPAIWMLPTDAVYGGWPASGEIDIMELRGQEPDVVHGTLHFGDMWNKNSYVGCPYKRPAGKFSTDFHVFAVEWAPDAIRWFVDGELYATQLPRGAPRLASVCQSTTGGAVVPTRNENVADPGAGWYSVSADPPAPFNRRFHILLNIAVGGGFVGNVDPSVFPQSMRVDYVRVYQR